jgi:hypothetical protein
MGQRARQQPIGQPSVPGKKRPVEIRPDGRFDPSALQAVLAVVPEPCDDPAEGLGAGVQMSSARVVLEAGKRPPIPGLEFAFEQDIADHAALAGDRVVREEADPGELGP